MNTIHLAIISTGRPGNVQFIQKFCEPYHCHWYVNDGERCAYAESGAFSVKECGNNISAARNEALSDAWANDLVSCQLSDDIRHIKLIDRTKKQKFIDFQEAINTLLIAQAVTGCKIVGVAPTENPLNYTGDDVSINKLVGFSLFVYKGPGELFDPATALKEDYDMNVYMALNGGIARCNNLLCMFPHRGNAGGANAYRNDSTEAAANAAVMAKWPKYLIPHKTRPGQISIDYKAIERKIKGVEPRSLFD